MIAYLHGEVKFKGEYLIIETQGVGNKVHAGEKLINNKKVGDVVEVYTHQYIREDALDLYGFETMEELRFFEDLISVSGIGPKSGLSVISKFNIEDVKKSIVNEDTSLLTKVSGIGKKTAERLIVELKNKLDVLDSGGYQASAQVDDEATEALVSLGYNKADAVKALMKVDEDLTLEDKVKAALRNI